MTRPDAYSRDGKPIFASTFPPDEWDAMKSFSKDVPLAFRMGCCNARAVLKTSINGVQFFAHYSDECATAPETKWHVHGKDLILGALAKQGVKGGLEVSGSHGRNKWKSDVFFELGPRKVAIELQRSYQHLRDYLRRQSRYRDANIECYWLLREPFTLTLVKAISRKRLKEEFGGRMPSEGFSAVLPDFHFAQLNVDGKSSIQSPMLSLELEDWVSAIVKREIYFDGVIWKVGR